MIDALKSDELINKLGGRFRLTSLLQRRWLQLMQGARPMVDTKGLSDIEIAIAELLEGKIEAIVPEDTAESDDAV